MGRTKNVGGIRKEGGLEIKEKDDEFSSFIKSSDIPFFDLFNDDRERPRTYNTGRTRNVGGLRTGESDNFIISELKVKKLEE